VAARFVEKIDKEIVRQRNHMSKWQVIEAREGDKRYAKRDSQGQFTDSPVNVGRFLAPDGRSKSKTVAL